LNQGIQAVIKAPSLGRDSCCEREGYRLPLIRVTANQLPGSDANQAIQFLKSVPKV
jgi:hypothetical protein